MRRSILVIGIVSAVLTACISGEPSLPAVTPSPYNPFIPIQGDSSVPIPPSPGPGQPLPTLTPTEAPFIVPTAVPLSQLLPTPWPAGVPRSSPTPDPPRALPTLRQTVEQYVVQPGDTLGRIAQNFGVSIADLMRANQLNDPNLLQVGQVLIIPTPEPGAIGPSFKIIPDSELVYGPASIGFDIEAFLKKQGGYLATFQQEINGQTYTAAQIIQQVAQNFSVNPRLLLALIEYRSGWVTRRQPGQKDYALNIADPRRPGLYLQLTYAANELNRGYYLWRANAIASWTLADGSVVPIDPRINAGTAAVQHFFATLEGRAGWQAAVEPFGLFQTYFFLFGSPFDRAVEPLVPEWLIQPRLALPFERGVPWLFTGGPHGGWGDGSAWAALDFAPFLDQPGCVPSEDWVIAVTDGLIVRSENGVVIHDLDGDGYEQTGWVILYLHIESRDRVAPGTRVRGGISRIGHPSCEGGASNATHLHIARKYNGEWIPADGPIPFILDNWKAIRAGTEYDGFLQRGSVILEALEGISEQNTLSR